jgi:hypothetical protein
MQRGKKTTLERLSWKEAKLFIQEANPSLYAIIDKISPPDDHYLYLASYSFGSDISKAKTVYLPFEDGSSVPHYASNISEEILDDLRHYEALDTIPPILILDKTVSISLTCLLYTSDAADDM